MLQFLKDLDARLFLFLNGKHDAFFDPIMYWASNKFFWFPFYALLIFLLIRWYRKRSVLILVSVAVLITLSDQLASHLIKNLVRRPRPSHAPALAGLVHLSPAGAGGMFGFVSSHAANCVALTVFLGVMLAGRHRWLRYVLWAWALLVCYSRIYVGVHYPGDVVAGALLGAALGYGIGHACRSLSRRLYGPPADSPVQRPR